MESSGQSSVVSNVYQVQRSIPNVNIAPKDKSSSGEPLTDCKVIARGKTRKVTIENASSSQGVEINSSIPLDGLLPTVVNRGEPSSIVIGEPVEGCMMVDLPGSMVKGGTSVQVQSVPYLIDQQVLVQVSGEQRIEAETSGAADLVSVYVKSRHSTSGAAASDGSNPLDTTSDRCTSVEQPNGSDLGHRKPGLIESRFVFQELSRDEYPTISLSEGSQKENFGIKLENEDDSLQMPRRKSARKARLKWKSLEEEDHVIKKINCLKKRKHYPLSSSDRGRTLNSMKVEVPLADIPVWAQYLTNVRIIDGKWIYGIAASKAILHQALEGHSRSILCDYIKSHPCNFEKRRNARSQECRIMWQHKRVIFDGVPFIIASSDDLKCTFGMNYKFKKKKSDELSEITVPGEFINEENVGKATENSSVEKKSKVTSVSATPKKAYKDVMFTSCPAKITVKVIVKYPGYGVHPLSFPAERKVRLKALRAALSKKIEVEKEELYYVTLPLGSVHNHEFTGRSRNIHPSIITKVKELVLNGITAPKLLKKLLDNHVQMEHGRDIVTPHPDDRAYYPKVKDIGNLVYNYCKKMGISNKRKSVGQSVEVMAGKRKHHKSQQSDEENGECCNTAISDNSPLQASTLQEAVQTFCTDESDRGNVSVGEQDCNPGTAVMPNPSSEVTSLAEMVRGQLETLRSITYSLTEAGSLQELYQSLQGILSHYAPVNQQILQGSLSSGTAPTAAFIIHESVIDPLAVGEDPLQVGVSEAIPSSLTVPIRDAGGIVTTAKFRNAQMVDNAHLRQFKPPVALQCLTTNVVPALTMSQLTRSSNPASEQSSAHIVTSLPSNSTASTSTVSVTQPTYQTVAPVSQDAPAVPVQLSLPPYFYYVQEVTVPESSSATPSHNAR
ncbi:uncharacterized protein [Palaemon carinicauda]|uniref:uncharacterized protein n=1 Tax=Palaemon carinicauda TaxID=392227 RepID=UPI0035B597DF